MNTQITIGQLGKLVDLSTKTIRFYEDVGLLTRGKRAENGYRIYDASIVEELKLIKHARDLGLPIVEIKKLMKGCENSCSHTREYVQTEIRNYIDLLDQKIAQLTLLKTRLQHLKERVHTDDTCEEDRYCCNVLHQLSTIRKGGEKK